MPVELVTTGYGAAAYVALGEVVAAAKGDDPLAPVTLVVPTNLCGVVARRVLARGYRDGRPGVAGLSVATLPRLAERLAAPGLSAAGRRPLTTPVLGAAWRRALAADPGPLEPVARHPATVWALVEAYRALRDLSDGALDAVAGTSALCGHVIGLYRRVAGMLAVGWYDTVDLLREAAQAEAPPGTVVVFLPQDLDRSSVSLVGALAAGTEVVMVAGLTGAPRADEAICRTADALGLHGRGREAVEPPTATRVLHASDPDDEVRCVVREVVHALGGTPAHRIAVLYGPAHPYARLLHEHLGAAGVTVNGAGVRAGHEHAVCRSLLGLLALPDHDLRRDDVFRLLAGVPVCTGGGELVPTSRWERISRAAGVVKAADWDTRLRAYTDFERAAAAAERASADPNEGPIARHEQDADAAGSLREFVADLAAALQEGTKATTWEQLGPWAQDLFRRLFADGLNHARVPREEARAADLVERVLAGLQGLAEIEPTADLALLREVVDLELSDSRPRVGRFGEGVLVAPLSSAIGLDVDVVFVLGLSEDLYPGRYREDSLLPERARAAAGGELPTFQQRAGRQHRCLLAAFAAAPSVVASFPRGDLSRRGRRLPSRWLLPTMRELSGDPELAATRWESVHSDGWLTSSPSFSGTLTSTDRPATEQEWRLRTLAAGQPIHDPVRDAAVAMIRARASNAFTRYDGNLAGLDLPDIADGQHLVSPTALEAWAVCPHAYFMRRMLGVEPVESPAEVLQISPLDIGRLVHETFDAFVKEMAAELPAPGQPWTPTQRDRLLELAVAKGTEYEQRGVTGHPRLWQQELARILADLSWLLDADDQWRAASRARLLAAEMRFGMDGEPPVPVMVPGGRAIVFRGSADRVDRAGDGTLVVVDLKTGSTKAFKDLGGGRPGSGRHQTAVARLRTRGPATVRHRGHPGGGGVLVRPQRPRRLGLVAAHPGCRAGVCTDTGDHRRRHRRRSVPAASVTAAGLGLGRLRLLRPGRARPLRRPGSLGTQAPRPGACSLRGPDRTRLARPAQSTGGTVMAADLVDQDARQRIVSCLGETLFVNAGAGTGKTRLLIDRVAETVLGGVPMANIAVVTFTEQAGAELRDRLRARFEEAAAYPQHQACAEQALDELDGAAIGTLHSFAYRVLSDHPIEAGLPPLIDVLDEVESGVAFDERWTEQCAALLDDDSLGESLLFAMAAGITLDNLRSLARKFTDDWDLVADRVLAADPPGPASIPNIAPLAAQARRLAALADRCINDDDRLLPKLADLDTWADRLDAATDPPARLGVLGECAGWKFGRAGNAGNWPGSDLDEIREACSELAREAKAIVGRIQNASLRMLAQRIATMVLGAARARQADGRLEFHDLLVLARELVRTRPQVRAELAGRYQRLFLDEFQDADPIQIELAVRIAAGASGSEPGWADVTVPAGRLFVVGDPKQSIYRFRRADIATYLRAQEVLGSSPALTTNFRTASPVLEWVNATFSQLIQTAPGSQPDYVPLDANRNPPPGGRPVVVLGRDAHPGRLGAGELRSREAADVAAVITAMLAEEWQVKNEQNGQWRAARFSDIAILVPARTSLPQLEAELNAAGVPYRAEAGSLVYQAQQVRDLLAAARAIDDPSDTLSLVTALRSPLFGCGDDDLLTWRQRGRSFSMFVPVDGGEGHPVAGALAYLRDLHRRARWMAPSEVLGALVTDRRMLETAADDGPRTRDHWRRLRFVIDQARAWAHAEHGGLRAYLAWAGRQGQESARVAEAVLPETDTDAVLVMTIHAAKGLEFPIVILSGMTSQPRRSRGVQVLWPPAGGCEVKLGSRNQTGDFDASQPVDEQMASDERARLLYVACTRARDHLVVSMHRCGTTQTNAALLAEASSDVPAVTFAAPPDVAPLVVPRQRSGPPPPGWDDWHDRITSARERTRLVSAVSASGLEGTDVLHRPGEAPIDPGLAKDARDLELPPWYEGRFGTAIGRAVHAVLQEVDLATGAALDHIVAAQALAEGVAEHAGIVRSLAQSALSSPIVRRAASRPHWKETYVGTVVPAASVSALASALDVHAGDGEIVLEGFVDLLYRDDDGLVIVDYKTDTVPAGAIASRISLYRPQLAAYARALEDATGESVARTVLLFLTPARAYEHTLHERSRSGS
jgi:ATP-dependent helicase/nuclease subunit A